MCPVKQAAVAPLPAPLSAMMVALPELPEIPVAVDNESTVTVPGKFALGVPLVGAVRVRATFPLVCPAKDRLLLPVGAMTH